MAFAATRTASQPLGELNTTPLIDVLLVLLVMFIITIPVATHEIPVDLPGDVEPPPLPRPDPVINRLILTQNDALLWNGEPITSPQLAGLLDQTLLYPVEPELQFAPEAQTSYDASARTLAIIKASGVTRFGFVGNERYRSFSAAE